MFSRISLRMASESGDVNAVQTDPESNSSESSIKAPKRGLDQGGEDNPPSQETGDSEGTAPPPNKIARFELTVKSNNSWALDPDLAKYANDYILNFAPVQTLAERILDKNPVPTNIKGENLLDPYLRELMVEQNKRIPLSQDKALSKLQQKIAAVYGPLCKIWHAMEGEKEAMEESGESLDSQHPLTELSHLLDQVLILLGQSVNSCTYTRRFNILMAFINDKKRVEVMMKENADAFIDESNANMLFGPKFEETVAKSLTSKSKSKEFFGALNQPASSSTKEPTKHNKPFPRVPLFRARGGRGRGSFNQTGQGAQFSGGTPNRGNIVFSSTSTAPQHSRTFVTNRIQSDTPPNSFSISFKNTQSPKSWKIEILPKKLEETNKRSDNTRNNSGICNPFKFLSRAIKASKNLENDGGGNKTSGSRSSGNVEERGDFINKCFKGSIFKHALSSREKGWGESSGHQSERVEQINPICSLQNGRSFPTEGNAIARGLNDKSGFKGCIFPSTISQKIQKICEVPVERKPVRVSVPMFWPIVSPQDIYKIDESTNFNFEKTLHTNNNLFRRYACDGEQLKGHSNGSRHFDSFTAKFRFSNQHSKINTRTDIDFGIFRSSSELPGYDFESPKRKDCKNSGSMQRYSESTTDLNQKFKQIDWQTSLHSNSNSSSTSPIQGFATQSNKGDVIKEFLGGQSISHRAGKKGTQMVDSKFKSLQWEVSDNSPSPNDNKFRRLEGGVGGCVSRETNRRPLVARREEIPYKCPRAESSQISNNDVHNFTENGFSSTYKDGQHGCIVLPTENGRDEEPRNGVSQQGNMGLPLISQNNYNSRIPPRGDEYGSGLGIEECKGLKRMEIENKCVQNDLPKKGNTRLRPICLKDFTSTTSVHVLENGPLQQGPGCLSNKLESNLRLRFPPFCTDRKGFEKGTTRSSFNDHNHPSLANTNMVPRIAQNVNQEPNPSSRQSGPFSGPIRKSPSLNSTKRLKTSGLDHLRESLHAEGISKRATTLITQSRRASSLKHYESAWGKWVSWCSGRKICPTRCDITNILDYLAELFETGLEYSTIGSHRSAISAFHDPIENKKIGEHPRVSALMTGVFNQRPPQPRYTFIWDVETVLIYLRSQPEDNDLSNKLLTLKLVLLIALTSASRASELTNLNKKCLLRSEVYYVFHQNKLSKTWSKDRPKPQNVKLYKFFEDKKLCPCNTLESYLTRRKSWGVKEPQVLVSFTKPHKPVCSSTVSRWLKQILGLAGIDTSIFKGHSTRSASSSKAEVSGASVSDIMKQGHWSRTSTFQRFYKKEILDPSAIYQAAVLNNKL